MKHQRYQVYTPIYITALEEKLNKIGAEPGWRVFQVVEVNQPYYMVIAVQEMAHGNPTTTEEDV